MVELAVVGGTPKSSTIPPREIGSAATLNDIRTWARNSPINGSQEVRSVSGMGRGFLLRVGEGGEQVQPERSREEGAGPLAAHDVAGPEQRRRVGAGLALACVDTGTSLARACILSRHDHKLA